ncbi:lysophospholipid acyltransferase family protein [Desulfatiglans anilini]|uniref:lysophospholipid acyltransferase family protein n=1 Tax=Desulfatiglans anilini TaxID=90728 RepID=UPI000413AA75|nr:lysophospholipid acyltransferase family protein [Desulfatiglans anilini]
MRFILLNAYIAIDTILFCLWTAILAIFDRTGDTIHAWVARPWGKSILWGCGVKVRVVGAEGVDGSKPRIYMSNHQSFFDIFALLAYLPVNFKFIMKQELMRIPLFGFAVRRAGYIGIVRDDPRKAVESMNKAAQRIRDGASVLIFPEGTRSIDGSLQGFKRGGFNLAVKSGCDIVPIGISGSHAIVPKGSLRVNRGTIEMRIGAPISLADYGKRDIQKLEMDVWLAIDKLISPHRESAGHPS